MKKSNPTSELPLRSLVYRHVAAKIFIECLKHLERLELQLLYAKLLRCKGGIDAVQTIFHRLAGVSFLALLWGGPLFIRIPSTMFFSARALPSVVVHWLWLLVGYTLVVLPLIVIIQHQKNEIYMKLDLLEWQLCGQPPEMKTKPQKQ